MLVDIIISSFLFSFYCNNLHLVANKRYITQADEPEAVSRVMKGTHESPGRWQVGSHWRAGQWEVVVVHAVAVVVVVAVSVWTGWVGKLDGDWLAGAVRDEPVQLFDWTFCLVTLIKPHEPDTFRQTYRQRLNRLVVSALGIRTRGHRFDSRVVPLFHWVATLGKLFTDSASPVSQLQETGVQKGSFRRLSGYGD